MSLFIRNYKAEPIGLVSVKLSYALALVSQLKNVRLPKWLKGMVGL